MARTDKLIRETIGRDNNLLPYGQKQLELNREGSIDVRHLFQPQSATIASKTQTSHMKYGTMIPLYASVQTWAISLFVLEMMSLCVSQAGSVHPLSFSPDSGSTDRYYHAYLYVAF